MSILSQHRAMTLLAAAILVIPGTYLIMRTTSYFQNTKKSHIAGFPVAPASVWSQLLQALKKPYVDRIGDLEKLVGGAREFWFEGLAGRMLRIGSLDSVKFLLMKVQSLIGNHSLLFATVSAKRIRTILLKSMTKPILAATYQILRESSARTIAHLSEASSNGTPIQTFRPICRFTFKAISANIFGAVPEQDDRFNNLFDDFIIWEAGLVDIFIPVWMNGPKAVEARKRIVRVIQSIIDERREMMRLEPEREFNDALSLFLRGGKREEKKEKEEEEEGITDLEIIDNLLVFGLAGYATLVDFLIIVHISEDDFTILRNEIVTTPRPDEASISSMPVLEAFVKEVLRLYAPTAFIRRTAVKDIELPDGRVIPKGSFINIDIAGNAYNEDIFPDANSFRLDRYLVESVDKKCPFALTPFSAGPRMCVGYQLAKLEIKTLLCELIQNYAVIKSDVPTKLIPLPTYVMNPTVFIRRRAEE
ncbi:Thromboxane-A synthase [Blyttiomyces sp. JEL0837]|nr:Thromboxane-A synthase [Blyttiomyces sp. JEL0837]